MIKGPPTLELSTCACVSDCKFCRARISESTCTYIPDPTRNWIFVPSCLAMPAYHSSWNRTGHRNRMSFAKSSGDEYNATFSQTQAAQNSGATPAATAHVDADLDEPPEPVDANEDAARTTEGINGGNSAAMTEPAGPPCETRTSTWPCPRHALQWVWPAALSSADTAASADRAARATPLDADSWSASDGPTAWEHG
jgi:hypothetical protein